MNIERLQKLLQPNSMHEIKRKKDDYLFKIVMQEIMIQMVNDIIVFSFYRYYSANLMSVTILHNTDMEKLQAN